MARSASRRRRQPKVLASRTCSQPMDVFSTPTSQYTTGQTYASSENNLLIKHEPPIPEYPSTERCVTTDETFERPLSAPDPRLDDPPLKPPSQARFAAPFDVLLETETNESDTRIRRLYDLAIRISAEQSERSLILWVALAPLACILIFPILVVLRLLVVLVFPLVALAPIIPISRRARASRWQQILFISLYIGSLSLAALPFGLVLPVYLIFEILPICLVSVPLLLSFVPLLLIASTASLVLWYTARIPIHKG